MNATLGVLRYGYKDYEMRWYVKLFRKLNPTIQEIKDRESLWLDLLGDRNASAQALGFDMLMELEKSNQLDLHLFVKAIAPPFNEKPKARSMKVVQLLRKIAQSDSALQKNVLETALLALKRSEADIQKEALKIIQKYISADDTDFRKRLTEQVPYLAASVQSLLMDKMTNNGLILCGSDEINTENNVKTDVTTKFSKETNTFAADTKIQPVPEIYKKEDFNSIGLDGPFALPRLSLTDKIQPLASFDDVLDLALHVIESPVNYEEYELLLDGMARLYYQRPDDLPKRTSAIRKRILTVPEYFSSDFFSCEKYIKSPERVMSGIYILIKALVSDEIILSKNHDSITIRIEDKSFSYIINNYTKCMLSTSNFRDRVLDYLCRYVRETDLPLLAFPTHHGGWIDPIALVERINSIGNHLDKICIAEKIGSLYRLPLENRSEALKALKTDNETDPYLMVLRLILSCNDETPKELPVYYRAAHDVDIALRQGRPLFGYDINQWQLQEEEYNDNSNTLIDHQIRPNEYFAPWQQDKYNWEYTKSGVSKIRLSFEYIDGSYNTFETLHQEMSDIDYENKWIRAVYQWRAWLTPALHEPFYWHGMRRIQSDKECTTDWQIPSVFFEPMLDRGEPIPLTGAILVLFGLAFKTETTSIYAQDILVKAISEKRLNLKIFVRAADYWLDQKLPRRIRWCKHFVTIASVSCTHTNFIRLALEAILPRFDNKEIGPFLDLLNELCHASNLPVQDNECRKFLSQLKGGSKAAKTAKQLLQLQ